MSQLEVAQNSSPIYSFLLPAMAGGLATTTNVAADNLPIYNNFGACSKVVGIVRTSNAGGGAVSTKQTLTISDNVPCSVGALGYIPIIKLSGNNNTDTSRYTIYWINEVAKSGNQTVYPC